MISIVKMVVVMVLSRFVVWRTARRTELADRVQISLAGREQRAGC